MHRNPRMLGENLRNSSLTYRVTSKTLPCFSGTLANTGQTTFYKIPEKHSHV